MDGIKTSIRLVFSLLGYVGEGVGDCGDEFDESVCGGRNVLYLIGVVTKRQPNENIMATEWMDV